MENPHYFKLSVVVQPRFVFPGNLLYFISLALNYRSQWRSCFDNNIRIVKCVTVYIKSQLKFSSNQPTESIPIFSAQLFIFPLKCLFRIIFTLSSITRHCVITFLRSCVERMFNTFYICIPNQVVRFELTFKHYITYKD